MKYWRRLLGKTPESFVLGKAGISANICSAISITSVDPISHAQGIIVIFFLGFLDIGHVLLCLGWWMARKKMRNPHGCIIPHNDIRSFPCLCTHEATQGGRDPPGSAGTMRTALNISVASHDCNQACFIPDMLS